MKKNKGIAALIIGVLLLFSFRNRSRGSVSVDQPQSALRTKYSQKNVATTKLTKISNQSEHA
jgi:hypothetical protein